MTMITKTSYVDNWTSDKKGYVEIGYKGKKAYAKKGTGSLDNPHNIPLNAQAVKMGIAIAKYGY